MTLAISGTTGITLAGQFDSASTFGYRNRIINGGMVIDQRNAGASVTGNDTVFNVDRFMCQSTQTSKFTVQQNAGTVTPPVGFSNYLGVTSSSAYSVLAGDYFNIVQKIEGFNTSDLAWGTANAATVTVSFWVRSSLTGTFGGVIQNSGYTRSYPFSYTISSANTWEQKSIIIAGDTTGTWVGATNGIGLRLAFSLGCGSTYAGTSGAWFAGEKEGVTGATSVVGTNGATFYITGVQLEKGSVATSFDFRSYGTELALCQRYFAAINPTSTLALGLSTTTVRVGLQSPSTMRTTPTFTRVGSLVRVVASGIDVTQSATSFTDASSSANLAVVQLGNFTGLTANAVYVVADGSATIGLNAEL